MTVRLSQDEHDSLAAAAKSCGFTSVSGYVRSVSLGQSVKPVAGRELIDSLLSIDKRLGEIPECVADNKARNKDVVPLLRRMETTRREINRKLLEL